VSEGSAREGLESSTREGAHGVIRFAIYSGLGGLVGLVVVALEWLTIEVVLDRLLDAPLGIQLGMPAVGLVVTALVLRVTRQPTTSTAEAYVKSFHTNEELPVSSIGPKLTAALATIGLGGAAGLEGPSIYAGAALGQLIGRFKLAALGARSERVLLVAGAAAGVAAVFKAPATGVLFALETPYRRDVARHALIPALLASAAAYLTFVLILGADPLLDIAPAEIRFRDEVFGAIVLGVLGGGVAHVMARLFKFAKRSQTLYPLWQRVILGGTALACCLLAATALVDKPATLGPGAGAIIEIVLDPNVSVWAIGALFCLRALATSATLSAGGVGGLFIPLVVQGLLLGRMVEVLFDAPATGLYPVVGLAAVLGAGYRTPLAAVVFVAETTGRAEFVIPALLATAVSQSLMGEVSVSGNQRSERQGQLEHRLSLPAIEVTITGLGHVAPTDLLLDVIDRYGAQPVAPAVPVCDTEYCGLLVLHDIATVMMNQGIEATVGDAMRFVDAVRATDPAMAAARRMNETDTAAVAVVDDDNQPVGVISAMSLAGLRDLE
jgi:CIC family chloride channel protein